MKCKDCYNAKVFVRDSLPRTMKDARVRCRHLAHSRADGSYALTTILQTLPDPERNRDTCKIFVSMD